jgi:hypothetical protein
MKENDTEGAPAEGAEQARGRRPYVAPCIEQSGDFERLVLACSHLPGPTKKTGCPLISQSS